VNGPRCSARLPGVEEAQREAGGVAGVAGDHSEIMDEGGCGNQRIALGTRIGDVTGRAGEGDALIDGENSTGERPLNLALDPLAQPDGTRRVTPLEPERADLDFHPRNDREKAVTEIHEACRGSQGRRLPIQKTKCREDLGIEQVHLVEIHRPHQGPLQARRLEVDVGAAWVSEAIGDGAPARDPLACLYWA
jgi:hypothetical protein